MAPAVEYLVFASWGSGPTARYVGTVDELRGGNWYEGRLAEIPGLANRFGDTFGLQSANDVLLTIADGPGGIYRGDVLAGTMEGTVVLVTLVMRSTDAATGAPAETTVTQSLTVVGSGLAPGAVKLKLVDLEEVKMRGLYPPTLWQASDWPNISDREAGRPACFPIGTALKLPATQIRVDTTNLEWQFGACEAVAKAYVITSVSGGLKRFFTAVDLRAELVVGQVIIVTGSAASDGRYTVASVLVDRVNVVETVPVSAGGGTLRIMPHPLTVYRNGRVVGVSEYAVQHLYNPGTVHNGDFALGSAGWTTWYWNPVNGYTNTPNASSTIAFGAGGCTITSVSGATDIAFVQQYGSSAGTFAGIRGGRFAVQVTIAAGASDAVVTADGPPVMKYRCPAGKMTTVILECTTTGAGNSFSIGVWNHAGTITITRVRFIPLSAVLLQFAREQLDFQGSPYAVECDMRGVESRNCADEISRLLTHAGLTPDAGTFAAASAVATSEVMLVDCDYGRAGQRRVSSILGDLLFVARGGLTRTASGSYAIWQDVAGSVVASYDESLGDPIAVESYDREGRPKSVGIKYRPGGKDPGTLQNTITRQISGGVMGDETPREIAYLRDHVAADRLLSYRAARATANGVAQATVYRQQRTLGEVISVASPINWTGPLSWKIRSITRGPNENALELIQYDAAVYTYTPSESIGQDSSDAYSPDYSNTPPAAPSAMSITGGGTSVTRDGNSGARISVQATPPTVNWAEMWFAVIHDVTGEIIRQQGVVAAGVATANIGGLRAGEVYQLKSYAINGFNVQGVILDTFNATAIGGGAAVTTFTAPGLTALPPDVSAISLDQGTGRLINVSWPAVALSNDNLAEYVLERNPGTGTFTEIWRGRALSYVDRNVSYATSYIYRVKARDRWGNLSANWRTSSSMLVVRNISGSGTGDIMDATVETVNRSATTLHIMNIAHSGQFMVQQLQAHGMIKEPMASVVNVQTQYISVIRALDATNVEVAMFYFGTGDTSANAPTNPHSHNFRSPSPGGFQSVRLIYW